MPLDTEPIYCAEQIVVPPELADILKAFTKEVIRRQPEDLLDFSARYFGELAGAANVADGIAPPNISQLRSLYMQIRDLSEMKAMDFIESCVAVGIAQRTAQAAVLSDVINPTACIATMVSMTADSVEAAVQGLFEVFAKGGAFNTAEFVDLLPMIATPDEAIVFQELAEAAGPTVTLADVLKN